MQFIHADNFDEWRDAARRLLLQEVAPSEVRWSSGDKQPSLFEPAPTEDLPLNSSFNVPKAFIDVARIVACHRDARRWSLLYRTLWRLLHGEKNLMQMSTDDDVYEVLKMKKAVTRDVHKMKAFVRFRKVVSPRDASSVPVENYIAWHRPDHRIVRLAAPFFARRFAGMNWSILTPDESVIWDQTTLQYGPGVPVSEAPDPDVLEDLWKTYYASIFNPARIKINAMKREMPVRHWATIARDDFDRTIASRGSRTSRGDDRAPRRLQPDRHGLHAERSEQSRFAPRGRSGLPGMRALSARDTDSLW